MSDGILLEDMLPQDTRPGHRWREGDTHLTLEGITHIAAPREGHVIAIAIVGMIVVATIVGLVFVFVIQFPLAGIPIGLLAGVAWAVRWMRRANQLRAAWRAGLRSQPLEQQQARCPGSWHLPANEIKRVTRERGGGMTSDLLVFHLQEAQRITLAHPSPAGFDEAWAWIERQGWPTR